MRLDRFEKILLAVLTVTFAINLAATPGFGVETRPADAFAPPLVAAFAVVGLAPAALALVLLKWPRAAAWGAIAVAAAAVVLNVADFAGLWTEAATPAAIRAIEVALVGLAVAQIAMARNVLRGSAGAAAVERAAAE